MSDEWETYETCMFGQCTNPAVWIGVYRDDLLKYNETYPTAACDQHIRGLVCVRDLDGNYRGRI